MFLVVFSALALAGTSVAVGQPVTEAAPLRWVREVKESDGPQHFHYTCGVYWSDGGRVP